MSNLGKSMIIYLKNIDTYVLKKLEARIYKSV